MEGALLPGRVLGPAQPSPTSLPGTPEPPPDPASPHMLGRWGISRLQTQLWGRGGNSPICGKGHRRQPEELGRSSPCASCSAGGISGWRGTGRDVRLFLRQLSCTVPTPLTDLDGGDGEGDLAPPIYVGVEHSEDVLELLWDYKRLRGGRGGREGRKS